MGKRSPGTDITFTVSKMDRFGNMVETHRETVTVGSMGLFSETLPLSRGNNYISFAAEGEAKTTTVIKQVPQQVKSQLQPDDCAARHGCEKIKNQMKIN